MRGTSKKTKAYELVSEIENISYSAVLLKQMNNYKLKIQDSLNLTIGYFNFKSDKILKELYGCNYALNENQKLILVIDSKDLIFDSYSILNNKACKFLKTVSCIEYEPEESYE